VLACADSRVAPEVIFDQGLGDILVPRLAGNILSLEALGSLHYSVLPPPGGLGAHLIFVMGHSDCGAVRVALGQVDGDPPLPPALQSFVDPILPAAEEAEGPTPAAHLADAVARNVRNQALELLADPLVAERVADGLLGVAGGVFDLTTLEVRPVAV
jgi:carbonic anhydrase